MHNGVSYKCRTCFCTRNRIYSAGTMLSLCVTPIYGLCQETVNARVEMRSWGCFPVELSSCRSESGRKFSFLGRSLKVKEQGFTGWKTSTLVRWAEILNGRYSISMWEDATDIFTVTSQHTCAILRPAPLHSYLYFLRLSLNIQRSWKEREEKTNLSYKNHENITTRV